jgi:hypothetical protein
LAETFKVTNLNTEEDTTQPIDENEQKEENQSLKSPQTAENPELDTLKTEFYKALKEFEGTDPTIRHHIPKQKCSRKLTTIITTINQEILPEYLKYNVTDFLELHTTIYAAAVATVRISGARRERKQLNHSKNKTQAPPWERRFQKQIDELRKDTGRVQQIQNGNTSNRLQKHIRRIKKKVHVHAKHDPNTIQTRSKQCSHHGNT